MEQFKLKNLVNPNTWSDPILFIMFWICLLTLVVVSLISIAVL